MTQQYTAADMASAAAQGFKDGQAALRPVLSLTLNAIEALEGTSGWEGQVLGRLCDALRATLKELGE